MLRVTFTLLVELSKSSERALRRFWGKRAVSLSLPVSLALLFLGLECLFFSYILVVYLPLPYEPPAAYGLLDLWWYSEEHGAGVPAEFARVNVLIVVYLWVFNRVQRKQWWNRSNRLMLIGTGVLYLAVQYALYRLIHVPFAVYSLQVIELGP